MPAAFCDGDALASVNIFSYIGASALRKIRVDVRLNVENQILSKQILFEDVATTGHI